MCEVGFDPVRLTELKLNGFRLCMVVAVGGLNELLRYITQVEVR